MTLWYSQWGQGHTGVPVSRRGQESVLCHPHPRRVGGIFVARVWGLNWTRGLSPSQESDLTGKDQAVPSGYWWKQACSSHPSLTPKTISYVSKRKGWRGADSLLGRATGGGRKAETPRLALVHILLLKIQG